MKNSKKLLSLILTVIMLFSTFGEPALALSNNIGANNSNKGTEIEGEVKGNKEVFTFDFNKIKKEETPILKAKNFADIFRMAVPTADQGDTKVTVTTTALKGSTEFNWDALPKKEFKITAHWETTDGQTHTKELTPAINKAGIFNYTVGWPIDGTMKGDASLVVDFNQDIKVRVLDATSNTTPDGQTNLQFTIDLMELAEPRADVKYVDPYGRPLEEKDLPAADATMPKVTADELEGVSVDLPRESGQINMRESEDLLEDDLNTIFGGLSYKVGGKTDQQKVNIGEKTYLVDISQPDPKEVGQILMVSQPDVVIPPTKGDGSGEPVDVAKGYVRVTFDANENKTGGITGKHNVGAYQGQQKSYIDVRNDVNNPVKYDNDNLKAEIAKLSTTGTKNGITYNQDKTKAWEDGNKEAIPATGNVTEKTYYARYAKSDKDIIPYVPADPDNPTNPKDKNVPTEDEDNNPIDKSEYDIVAFKTADAAKGKLKVTIKKPGETKATEQEVEYYSALVKKNTNKKFADVKPEPTPVNPNKFWYWDEAKTAKTPVEDTKVVANGDIYTAHFINSGDEIEEDDPKLPDGMFKVTYQVGEGLKEFVEGEGQNKKTYAKKIVAVEKGTKEDKLPGKPVKANTTATPAKEVTKLTWTAAPKIDAQKGIEADTTLTATETDFDKDNITAVEYIKDPNKMSYYEGEKLDLTGIQIKLTDKNGISITIGAKDLATYGVEVKPADKTTLTVDANNGHKLEIKVNGKDPADTNKPKTFEFKSFQPLTVTKYVPVPEKSHEPIIDPIYDSDEVVTGEGEPGATIEVQFPDGTVERVPVDRDGRWIVPVPYPLYEDDIVRARQIEDRKTPSDWVSQRVRYDEDFWRDRRDRRDKEEKEVKKPVEPKKVWTPDALNARDHFSYIKGYGNNMFAPNRTITRAEVAMIFARLSINQSTVGAPQFKDVKAGDWYKTAVDIMARQGVIKGYEDGTFRPNQPITRREFAAIAARYAGNIDAWKTFRDVPPTDWAYTLINRVAGAGWINGYEDGTFRPNNNITRAEVVAIVNRMLNRKADKKYVDNNLMRAKDAFVDNMRSAWYFYDIYEAAIGHSFERQPNGVDEKWNRVNGQSFEIRER